jgi:hypothetical protein
MRDDLNEGLVKNKLRKYLNGQWTLREFTKWFVPATWDLEDSTPTRLRNLVYGADLLLAEYTGGHLTEDALRSLLTDLAGLERHEVRIEILAFASASQRRRIARNAVEVLAGFEVSVPLPLRWRQRQASGSAPARTRSVETCG